MHSTHIFHKFISFSEGAAACTALVRMLKYGSGRDNWGTFAERVRAYHGVCGSLAGDLAFSCAAFVAFAVCAGTETAITTLWPWKVREYAQREWEKANSPKKTFCDSIGGFVKPRHICFEAFWKHFEVFFKTKCQDSLVSKCFKPFQTNMPRV